MKPYFEENGIVIYHADCRDVLPSLPKVDLVLTDPPYGINAANRPDGGAVCSRASGSKNYGERSVWDEAVASQELVDDAIAKGREAIVWGGNYYLLPPSSCWLIWDKGQRDFSLADAELAWTSMSRATRIITLSRGEALLDGRFHPTQKPLVVIKWAIQQCKGVETILDPFMGSGTTLRAAKDLGRMAIGIEIEEKYCEIAAKRMSQEVLQFESAHNGLSNSTPTGSLSSPR
jgi:DNA modification methylase